MQYRNSNNIRDGHSSTHDTREGSSQKYIHVPIINSTPSPARRPPFTFPRERKREREREREREGERV